MGRFSSGSRQDEVSESIKPRPGSPGLYLPTPSLRLPTRPSQYCIKDEMLVGRTHRALATTGCLLESDDVRFASQAAWDRVCIEDGLVRRGRFWRWT